PPGDFAVLEEIRRAVASGPLDRERAAFGPVLDGGLLLCRRRARRAQRTVAPASRRRSDRYGQDAGGKRQERELLQSGRDLPPRSAPPRRRSAGRALRQFSAVRRGDEDRCGDSTAPPAHGSSGGV